MSLKPYFFALIASIFFNYITYAQLQFEDVGIEELQMEIYEKDTSASAVILFDKGYFDELKFTRYLRVKILNKAGLDWANWTFNTSAKSSFKVFVYNLDNGEIIKTKASNENIYEEVIFDNFLAYKVFAPNVKVGSIVDIRYNFFGLPREWRFQQNIPSIYNELHLERTTYIVYNKSFFGLEKINEIGLNHWSASHIPAFKHEPHMSSYKNYITKFEFQVSAMRTRGIDLEFSTSWDKVIEILLDNKRFGSILNGQSFLKDKAMEIRAKNLTIEEKVNEAVTYIKSYIKWDGSYKLLASKLIKKQFLENHNGNNADINLLIIDMLNQMGIRTFPVVLSTRDNGYLNQFVPTIDKLNHVIAYVKEGDTELFIDGTSEYAKPGILPLQCLNGQGLLINDKTALWIDLNKNKKEIKTQFIMMDIEEDGTGTATVSRQFKDYGYINLIKEIGETESDKNEYKYHFESVYDLVVSNYSLEKGDEHSMTATEKFTADISNHIINTSNGLILNPFIIPDFIQNPFNSKDRKLPIDFIVKKEYKTTMILTIPEQYELKVYPQSSKLINSDGTISLTTLTSKTLTGLQLITSFNIDKTIFTEADFKELKNLFGELIKMTTQPIELVKIK